MFQHKSKRDFNYIVVAPLASSRRCCNSALAASEQTNSFMHVSRPKAPLLHPQSLGLLQPKVFFQVERFLVGFNPFENSQIGNLTQKGVKKTKTLKESWQKFSFISDASNLTCPTLFRRALPATSSHFCPCAG